MRISDWSSDVCSSDLKWHDGEPFTAADVKCTWDLVAGLDGKKLRKSPRAAWYNNLESVTADGTMEATFHLKRAKPPFLALQIGRASGRARVRQYVENSVVAGSLKNNNKMTERRRS